MSEQVKILGDNVVLNDHKIKLLGCRDSKNG
jgi:hypothetical protein